MLHYFLTSCRSAEITASNAMTKTTAMIRLAVRLVVFFPEGIQKLIFPDTLGAGRLQRSVSPTRK
jgi:hypothetical protein